mgnify:CR=1 FL=1
MKNMKNIFSMTLLLAAAISFTACQGEEADLFDKSAAERLNAVADAYTAVLAEPASGWIMEYYPTNSNSNPTGLGYLMAVDFQEDGFVKVGMLNSLTGGAYEENLSVWEVITDNGPVLSFSTYNDILHYFSDPAIYDQGNGLSGDYEFVMVDVPEDHQTIMLKGKKRGTYVRLTRLPDGTDFETYLKDVYDFQNRIFSASAPNYDYVTLDGKVYTFDEPSTTLPNIYLKGYDAIANEYRLPFILAKKGDNYFVRFRTTLKFEEEGNDDIKGEQEFTYDPAKDIFVGVDNEANQISGSDPTEFMADVLDSHRSWGFNYGAEMSESVSALFTALYQDMYNNFRGTTFKRISITEVTSGEENKVQVGVVYRGVNNKGKPNSTDSRAAYNYNVVRNADHSLTLTYDAPANDASATLYNNLPTLQALLNALSKTIAAKPYESAFNLTSIIISDANDANFWFKANYNS